MTAYSTVGTVSMHGTVCIERWLVCLVVISFPAVQWEAKKPQYPSKRQSMGSSFIDHLLEANGKASFVKKIVRAATEQNYIIICYQRLWCLRAENVILSS